MKEGDEMKTTLKNITKGFAFLALLINYFGISINKHVYTSLEMGAYASMVMQLLIFGMYLANIKLKTISLPKN